MQETWDLIVVGGGAAGVFGAITAADSLDDKARILILEKSPQFLGKVKISGGGRCNVTHACFEPGEMSRAYPRGEKALLGPLHHWGVQETVDWFESRGVKLKTEDDGRMFPVSDESQTIINCLIQEAQLAGITMQTSQGVTEIRNEDESTDKPGQQESASRFTIITTQGDVLQSRCVLIATGGTRNASGEKLAQQLGHNVEPAVPSLFTFHINDERIEGLQGLSVDMAKLSIKEKPKLSCTGPVLITHWGLSGPAVLRLSAWGARELAALNYQFTLQVDWLAGDDNPKDLLYKARQMGGKRRVAGSSVCKTIPRRLWQNLCRSADIADDCTWSHLPKNTESSLIRELQDGHFEVTGKSTNKDEFVTCGGVRLNEINLRSMESRFCPGLYFAGEILDIDGITGGSNFQNAWTTAYLAGQAVACVQS